MQDQISLQLRDITFSYPSSPAPVLKNINLTIHRGEFVGIVARTGSGKSTLLGMMAGIVPHYHRGELEGEVFLYGQETRTLSLAKFGLHVGLVMQDPDAQLFNLLVRDEIVWGLENRGVARAEMAARYRAVLRFFDIEHLEERITHDLSGGEKQRVVIASIYVNQPSILLLDSPTSQLDPASSEYFIQSVKQVVDRHATVVMVEDKLDELLTHADRIVLLHEGEILLDAPPRAFVEHGALLRDLGITPPAVMELGLRLRAAGVAIDPIPLTLDEAVPVYRELCAGREPRRPAQPDSGGPSQRASPGEPAVTCRDVSFSYPPPQAVPVLHGIDLAIERSSFVAVVGQNGSGKTTLGRCLAGFLRPTRGAVQIARRDVHSIDIRERARRVGYVFQNPESQLFRMSVHDEVMFTLEYQGIRGADAAARVEDILSLLDLSHKARLHPFRLSAGDKQRLAIACIAVLRPDALIIDEPTTGQDPGHARAIMELLDQLRRQFGLTIIVITHAIDLAGDFCDRVIALHRGRVTLEGPPRRVFAEVERLAETSVKPPSITRLGLELGLDPPPLGIDEAEAMFRERLL